MAMFGKNWIEDSKDDSEPINVMKHWKDDEEKKDVSIFSKWKDEEKIEDDNDYEPIIKHFRD